MYALVAALVLFFLLAFPAATTLYFVHLSKRDGHWRELADRPGGAWLQIGRMFADNAAGMCRIFGLYPLGWLPSRAFPIRVRPGGGPRVLMIHGLFHNASAWFVFKRRLKRAGIGQAYTVTYDSFFKDFDQARERVAEAASALAADGSELALVGHSLGGLLARELLAHPEVGPKVRCVLTLGAPHQGSRLGSLSVNPMTRSLKHHGPLARRMAASRPVRDQPRLSLFSPVDNMVVPASALRLDAPGWEERETPPASHVGMVFHEPTIAEAVAFILQHCEKTQSC